MSGSAKKLHSSWRCPKCGREFARKSAYHGCGQYTVEGYLKGKNPEGVALFNKLVDLSQKIGPITLSAAKTQVSFRLRSNIMMVSVSGRQIGGYLFLPRPRAAPFVRKITAASARRHVHHFRISDPSMLVGEFQDMLAEAIAAVSDVGESHRLTRSNSSIGEEINALYRASRRA